MYMEHEDYSEMNAGVMEVPAEERAKALLERLRAQCARREYCESDIWKKVSREQLPPDIASGIVDSLRQDRYIDDLRYASAFARDKSSISGWGKLKIRHSLAAKGIDRGIIASALDGIEGNPGLEKLEKALETRAASLKDDPYRKFKLLRFALGRGYEYDEIKDLVDNILQYGKLQETNGKGD